MAILIGQETEGIEATGQINTELSHSFKFTAAATGKVTALHMTFSESGTGTSCNIAIQADEASKPKEGVIVEGVLASTAVGAHEVSVAETEVTEGTVYWLTIQPQGGTVKYKQGGATGRRIDSTKHKKVSEDTSAEWGVEANKGPVSIWASSSAAIATLAGVCKVKFGQAGALASEGGVTATLAGTCFVPFTTKGTLAQIGGSSEQELFGEPRTVGRSAHIRSRRL